MNLSSGVFEVPYEVFQLLDPLEKIVIRAQAERGEVRIIQDQSGGKDEA